MVETIVHWYSRESSFQGFLGGAGFCPSTVPVNRWFTLVVGRISMVFIHPSWYRGCVSKVFTVRKMWVPHKSGVPVVSL